MKNLDKKRKDTFVHKQKKQCDDECCVSAKHCHIEASIGIISDCEQPKQETLEEAAKNYSKIRNELDYGQLYCNSVDSFKAGAKWQQEKMYCEEEVLKIIDLLFHKYASSFRVDAKEDFLLSKKK